MSHEITAFTGEGFADVFVFSDLLTIVCSMSDFLCVPALFDGAY
jgi:hypothetical protein